MSYLYQRFNECAFVYEFDQRERADNFTVPARRALFAYYTEAAEASGSPLEFDPIAVCCEWCEYTEDELRAAFDMGPEELQDEALVIEVNHYRGESTFLVAG